MYFTGYPTYELLDSIIGDRQSFTIYYDIKNNLGSLYYEDSLRTLLETHGKLEAFKSILDYVVFIYKYSSSRKKRPYIVIFYDVGKSDYHRQILKSYKQSRLITSYKTLTLLEADTAWESIKVILDMAYKTCNYFFNTYVVRLEHLESDFVPYYYIKNKLLDSEVHIVVTTDKDMIQDLEFEDTYILESRSKKKSVITSDNWLSKFKIDGHLDVRHFKYMMSIIGDSGDDIPGVRGISWKGLFNIVSLVHNKIDLTDINSYIDSIVYSGLNKYTSKIKKIDENRDLIQTAYKLISFEELISNLNHYHKEDLSKPLNKVAKLSYKETVDSIKELYTYIGGELLEV